MSAVEYRSRGDNYHSVNSLSIETLCVQVFPYLRHYLLRYFLNLGIAVQYGSLSHNSSTYPSIDSLSLQSFLSGPMVR